MLLTPGTLCELWNAPSVCLLIVRDALQVTFVTVTVTFEMNAQLVWLLLESVDEQWNFIGKR